MEIYSAKKLKTVKLHGRVSSGSCRWSGLPLEIFFFLRGKVLFRGGGELFCGVFFLGALEREYGLGSLESKLGGELFGAGLKDIFLDGFLGSLGGSFLERSFRGA